MSIGVDTQSITELLLIDLFYNQCYPYTLISRIIFYLQLSYHLYVWYPPTRITNWLNITKDIILLASPPKTEFPLRNKLSASRIYTHISKARFRNRWYLIWWWNFRRFIVFLDKHFLSFYVIAKSAIVSIMREMGCFFVVMFYWNGHFSFIWSMYSSY